jgi:ribonuclease Z
MINLTFLGTSQAIPTATRNHTSILLSYKNENILIDCGEGTQRQFRKAKLNPCKITRLLITHWHGDHVLGLPGLFQTLALNNYSKTLHIYGPKKTKQFIIELFKIFIPAKKIKVEVHEINNKVLETEDFIIKATKLKHDIPCLGYSFIEKDKLRINKTKLSKIIKKIDKKNLKKLAELTKGRNIEINNKILKAKQLTYKKEGNKITIILDTKLTPNAIRLAKDSDLLITESTYSAEHKKLASDYNHLTTEQAAQIAKKSKSKKLILTHISQRYEYREKNLLKEAKKIFPNTLLAEDLMTVEV